ncbi:DUF362 domain-containing protein [Allofournierella sp. CML151]|uniref:DUF362 domain-containing protein n=1 Tax=Allofournierella sp. CML151 TaxID=2998082 RepID=UPI0022EB5DB1|nr:DUF362 domain-containing protein [Fournierella sp. CML151]
MDNNVYFAAAASYDQQTVDAAVERLFCQLPAAEALAGKKVLLKPNLLAKHTPERAVTTHPALVRAVIRAVRRRGAASIMVTDSPGGVYNPAILRSIYKVSGLADVCREEGAALYTDCRSRETASGGKLVRAFTLVEPVLDCDVLINLPKLKTHMMTGLSAATKNLFGCIPGLQKAEWHMRFPDKERFGEMLIDLLGCVKPGFAVLDGILAQEGDGPAGGTPRMVGLMAAAENHLQMDLALCHMLNIRPKDVPYLNAAIGRGLCPERFDLACARGEGELCRPIPGYRLPSSWGSVDFADKAPRAVRWAVPAVERLLAPRPVINKRLCIGCGKCAEICPQHTITVQGKAHIHPAKCIRCFCCHEMCPVKAIDTRRSFLLKKL